MTGVVLRPFASNEDYRQCLAVQDQTWGERFTERASVAMMMGAQRVGGVAAGAFDAKQQLLGFVFGFNGVREGRLAHWSYMLAVQRQFQGRGLGRRLKAFQRELLLASGIETVYWTYDPLVAANAHLNLSRLGARAIEYVPDMYGNDTGSHLHRDLGTDRFLVEWRLQDPRVEAALAHGLLLDAEALARAVLLEIPDDILQVRARSPEEAWQWRQRTRQAFSHYLDRGYAVAGWHRGAGENRSAYVLSPPS
jgi:chorismate synthase